MVLKLRVNKPNLYAFAATLHQDIPPEDDTSFVRFAENAHGLLFELGEFSHSVTLTATETGADWRDSWTWFTGGKLDIDSTTGVLTPEELAGFGMMEAETDDIESTEG